MDIARRITQTIGRVLPAYTPQVLLDIYHNTGQTVLYVGTSASELDQLQNTFAFFNTQGVSVLRFDGWDCLPYDRVSPSTHISAHRCSVLSHLISDRTTTHIVLTTVSAISQRLIPRPVLQGRAIHIKVGDTIDVSQLHLFLVNNGFRSTTTVRERGEFATRGGIMDIFPPDSPDPVRLDLFDTDIENIRTFDAMSQKSRHPIDGFCVYPASEVLLNDTTIASFRKKYRLQFGNQVTNDPLYDSISRSVPYQGYEHWLSLFYDILESLFDYIPVTSPIVFGNDTESALHAHRQDIDTYYTNRLQQYETAGTDTDGVYRPAPVADMYINSDSMGRYLHNRTVIYCHQSSVAHGYNLPVRASMHFTAARIQGDNIWQAFKEYVIRIKKPLLLTCNSRGEWERIRADLVDFGFAVTEVDTMADIPRIKGVGIAILPIVAGFESDDVAVISQQDIFGEKTLKNTRRRRNAHFITDYTTLDVGDLVVHATAGIGRYEGLVGLTINAALHDCVKVSFAGGDAIFVPVENIDILSRYGEATDAVQLDKLGGGAWHARKQRLQQRIGQMADALIAVAAERALKQGERFPPLQGLYDDFCESFPYVPTDDQARAIDDVLGDLTCGVPMDRLICGDVGFGKTEVAMRAIFCTVMNTAQVAIVAPTTLLVRQHYNTLCARFKGLPIHIGQLSRLTTGKNNTAVKRQLADGTLDIVVGTHGLFARTIQFKNLGMVVIDEEQSFGVAQKESLKRLKQNVHMLSLSATPIPRTLQTALSGVRDMSIIATPPIDRLPIRTFNMAYDGMVIKEALLRERWRGGQAYYVCPRVSDLHPVYKKVSALVPDVRIAVAHGGVPAKELDTIMDDFVQGNYHVLLATNIIESGIDVKTANTMVIHRADMFGMSHLYQLRGRIGRSNTQAYCYLTTDPYKKLNDNAKKRLQVIASLDTLGCGFNIASRDLDIRGAGNLLGAEQSGHVREVGVELYQRMLEQEILKRQQAADTDSDSRQQTDIFSPQISMGMAIYIPEDYIPDLSERLSFYRRLGRVENRTECDDITVEMGDRFGKIPETVHNLLKIVHLKILCLHAGIDKVDVGDNAVVIRFYQDTFAKPELLIAYATDSKGTVKLRPDKKLLVATTWKTVQQRIAGTESILQKLADMVVSNRHMHTAKVSQ